MKQHLEKWREVEARLVQKHAPFNVFALFLYEDIHRANQWEVVMAAPWLNRRLSFLREVDSVIKEVFEVTVPTDQNLAATYHTAFVGSILYDISRLNIIDMHHPDLPALLELATQEKHDAKGVLELRHCHLLGQDVAHAFILSAHSVAQLVSK